MSSVSGNGVGNLLITYKFQSEGVKNQIQEEIEVKRHIAEILSERGYRFTIASDEIIDEKLLGTGFE